MPHDFKKFPELTNRQMEIYYFESPHKQIMEDFDAKVVRVIDGDTIKVRWRERDFDFPVRFANTAAPELNEDGGPRSKSWLESQIAGEEILVSINPKNRVEKWGRILGTIMHSGMDINQMSIDTGHAIPFRDAGKLWGNFEWS